MFTYSSNPIDNTEVLWLWTNELTCLGCGVGAASVGGTATWPKTDRLMRDWDRDRRETDRNLWPTDDRLLTGLRVRQIGRWQTDDRQMTERQTGRQRPAVPKVRATPCYLLAATSPWDSQRPRPPRTPLLVQVSQVLKMLQLSCSHGVLLLEFGVLELELVGRLVGWLVSMWECSNSYCLFLMAHAIRLHNFTSWS